MSAPDIRKPVPDPLSSERAEWPSATAERRYGPDELTLDELAKLCRFLTGGLPPSADIDDELARDAIDLATHIRELQAEVAGLRATVAEKDEEIGRLRTAILQLKAAHAVIHTSANARIAELEEMLRELEELDEGMGHDLLWKDAHRAVSLARAALQSSPQPEGGWRPIESAPDNEEVLIAYWRWRNNMFPGSIIVQSAQRTEFHGRGIWSWVVSDNKHGPFPIRGWSDGDILGWMPLPPPPSGKEEA